MSPRLLSIYSLATTGKGLGEQELTYLPLGSKWIMSVSGIGSMQSKKNTYAPNCKCFFKKV